MARSNTHLPSAKCDENLVSPLKSPKLIHHTPKRVLLTSEHFPRRHRSSRQPSLIQSTTPYPLSPLIKRTMHSHAKNVLLTFGRHRVVTHSLQVSMVFCIRKVSARWSAALHRSSSMSLSTRAASTCSLQKPNRVFFTPCSQTT